MNIKIDKMRYQNNRISYWLTLLGLIVSIVAMFMTITYDSFGQTVTELNGAPSSARVEPDFLLGLSIGLSIIIILVTFMAAEKQKTYNLKWGYFTIALGAITILRIFESPLRLYTKVGANKGLPQLITSRFIIIIILSVVAGALFAVSGIISIKKSKLLKDHLKEGSK